MASKQQIAAGQGWIGCENAALQVGGQKTQVKVETVAYHQVIYQPETPDALDHHYITRPKGPQMGFKD